MVKPGPIEIIPTEQILTDDQIRAENIRYIDLVFQDSMHCVRWLVSHKLLRNSYICETCHTPMSLHKKAQLVEVGCIWACKVCICKVSIKKGSFFERSHLSLQKILLIMYGWSRSLLQKDIAHEAGMGEQTSHTLIAWCSSLRDICEQHLIEHPDKIGGEGKIVEVGWSHFFHQRFKKGQWTEGHCVLGGIEKGSGKCFLIEAPAKTSDALREIIHQQIAPGTLIITDEWSGYNCIEEIDDGIYRHEITFPHNNPKMENIWMRQKRKLRNQFGKSKLHTTSHLHEFVWKNSFCNKNIFSEFILCIQKQYNFNSNVNTESRCITSKDGKDKE